MPRPLKHIPTARLRRELDYLRNGKLPPNPTKAKAIRLELIIRRRRSEED